jgi:hypothetical protein
MNEDELERRIADNEGLPPIELAAAQDAVGAFRELADLERDKRLKAEAKLEKARQLIEQLELERRRLATELLEMKKGGGVAPRKAERRDAAGGH